MKNADIIIAIADKVMGWTKVPMISGGPLFRYSPSDIFWRRQDGEREYNFDPLNDERACAALLERLADRKNTDKDRFVAGAFTIGMPYFFICIEWAHIWKVEIIHDDECWQVEHPDRKRAICLAALYAYGIDAEHDEEEQ
jgi:hypothetical protein